MKIFLDVGGHRGETVEGVLSAKYRFDLVHCFEPIPELADFIKDKFAAEIATGKLQVHNFGLADFTGEQKLYGTGGNSKFADGLGATLFADKKDIDNTEFLTCQFVNASDWLKQNTAQDDLVFLKMNCEGGEVLILRDLMKSEKLLDMNFVYIDFDIVKIPSQKSEKNKVLAELKAIGFDRFITSKQCTHACLHHSDITHRMICAMPSATLVMDLTHYEIWFNRGRKYAPHWLLRKYLRAWKRKNLKSNREK